jgi:type II secretory pathway pseudopilin PulG
MRRSSKFRKCNRPTPGNPQRGYILITLMFAVALITIALLAIAPEVGQQVRRDRELELQHRGTAYMRAIQHYYKKFGRYPSRVEELENTNNIRFLRKRYKDPMSWDPATGKEKDFKFLHQTDVTLNNGPVLGAGVGQNLLGGAQGGISGGLNGAQAQQALGALAGGMGGLGGQAGGLQPGGGLAGPAAGSEDTADAADAEGKPNSPLSPTPGSSATSSSGLNGPTFGGGPILGVASTSKAQTIRVFYDKSHYNDWLFIYVPQADRGGLLTGPINPGMPSGNLGGATAGQPAGGLAGGGLPGGGLNGANPQNTPVQAPQNQGQTPPEP